MWVAVVLDTEPPEAIPCVHRSPQVMSASIVVGPISLRDEFCERNKVPAEYEVKILEIDPERVAALILSKGGLQVSSATL